LQPKRSGEAVTCVQFPRIKKTEEAMNSRIQPYPLAIALSFVFSILFGICIVLHFLLPDIGWPMYKLWEMILPGFAWLTTIGVLLGILEMFVGGFLVAYTFIPLYGFISHRLFTIEGGTEMHKLQFKPVAATLAIFGSVTYIVCIIFDFIFPQWAMYRLWEILLPGFTWISWGSFFIGLADVIIYGLYIAAVFVPVYNYFQGTRMPEVE